jgi:hypothetical protein
MENEPGGCVRLRSIWCCDGRNVHFVMRFAARSILKLESWLVFGLRSLGARTTRFSG